MKWKPQVLFLLDFMVGVTALLSGGLLVSLAMIGAEALATSGAVSTACPSF